jgi:hypothetical protein
VLTDGSGSSGQSRVSSTAEVLHRASARPGSVFGRFSDRTLYEVILEGRIEVLASLVREIAGSLIERSVETVVADAIEGFNPSHDLCRLLAGSAVLQARRRIGRAIASYEILLDSRPDAGRGNGSLCLELEEGALERKLATARSYPEMADRKGSRAPRRRSVSRRVPAAGRSRGGCRDSGRGAAGLRDLWGAPGRGGPLFSGLAVPRALPAAGPRS